MMTEIGESVRICRKIFQRGNFGLVFNYLSMRDINRSIQENVHKCHKQCHKQQAG